MSGISKCIAGKNQTIRELEARIKELKQEEIDWSFCQTELEKQYLRVEELEDAIREFITLDEGSYDSAPLRYEINKIQSKFKKLLED